MNDSGPDVPAQTDAAMLRKEQHMRRRAEALRENLLKRKQQSRARDGGEQEPS